MTNRSISVPVALLLDPDLTASFKVLWIATHLTPTVDLAELEQLTGLSRPTVVAGLALTKGLNRSVTGPRVKIPTALLAERAVRPQAKLLYGLLQTLPSLRHQSGFFTYTSLVAYTQLSRNTLKQAIAELAGAHWIQTNQANRISPIEFTLSTPERMRGLEAVRRAEGRLKRSRERGEALMKEYLSLLIDSDTFTDNARPGFLINPLTEERLEFDRFYPPSVAFEYHGDQHDRPTKRFNEAAVKEQQLRDLIKAGLCMYGGIRLVIVRAEDLSLKGMQRRIGQYLPLRELAGHGALIDLLEEMSCRYYAATEAARKAGT